MREGQCYTCYDDAMFVYHGYTDQWNPSQQAKDYVKGLEIDNEVECVVCGRKVRYNKNEEGKWKEEEI